MSNQFESIVQNLLSKNKNSGIDINTVSKIVESNEGKSLMRQLSSSGGDALKRAAAAAAEGDEDATAKMISTLMSTKEGQALAKQVMEVAKKAKASK